MDFFAQQDKARKKTKLLIFYFTVAVILIIAMIYFIVLFACFFTGAQQHRGYYAQDISQQNSPHLNLWNPDALLGASLVTLAIIIIGSAYKTNQLSSGGGALAESLGGRLVNPNSTDADERKLLNVVEEMSIASGVPMPKVYVLDYEKGINAFAAGHSTSDAAVAVTYGCMKLLSRDELQGVIGHEFSHILNGDMRLNLRLIGILFGILCIATIGRIFLYARSSNNRNNVGPIIGLALIVIGSIGVFFGRLIQSAISRQREFLADASSVQFTRNPSGLSGALQKIGGYGFGSWLTSEHAPDAGHLFFSNGIFGSHFAPLATHPPLAERIHAIDPTWSGEFPKIETEKIVAEGRARPRQARAMLFGEKAIVLGAAAAGATQPIKIADLDAPANVTASQRIGQEHVLPGLGNPTPLHLKYAEQLRNSLPENIKAAVHEPLAAAALIFALILSDDEKERAAQIAEIGKRFSQTVPEKTAALFLDVSAAAKHARLPMVNLAIGALRNLTPEQFVQFSETLQWLIHSDGKLELFEFVLQKIVMRHLDSQFLGVRKPTVQFYAVIPLLPDCSVILSALASAGSSDAGKIQKAFESGAPYLRAPRDTGLNLLPKQNCGVNELDAALNRLAQSAPLIKKNLLDACIHTVGADGVILESEAELLRAIADTLDCPIPPFVNAG